MPVRLGHSLTPEHEPRIEIIPLIDIMFFLLAAFMLVSLSMVNIRAIKVNLPAAATAEDQTGRHILRLTVNRAGTVFMGTEPIGANELLATLASQHQTNPTLRVFISGDENARHGDVSRVLDLVRIAGVDQVGFELRPTTP
jgi:biopolymer transport protein ExbD